MRTITPVLFFVSAVLQADKPAVRNARDLFLSGAAQPQQTSVQPGVPYPLAIRCSVLRLTSAGQFFEVPADTPFRTGDQMRLAIEVNDSAYLYVVSRGASGRWRMLFPSAELNGGLRTVQRGVRFEIPSDGLQTFAFHPPAGSEALFIVASRQPVADLERYVRPSPAPSPSAPESQLAGIMVPQGTVNVNTLDRLRDARTRDLIVSSPRQSGPAPDPGTYIASVGTSDTDYVVAELNLQHR